MTNDKVTGKLAHWALILQEYELTWYYTLEHGYHVAETPQYL